MAIEVLCWCGKETLPLPERLVGLAAPSCGPGCHQGSNLREESDSEEKGGRPMARFRIETYDPQDDSSAGGASPGCVGLVSGMTGYCHCGCGLTTRLISNGKGYSRFLQGHDQRLKGIVTRAAAAGVPIAMFDPGATSPFDTVDAVEYASGVFSGPAVAKIEASATAYQQQAEKRQANRLAKAKAKAAKAAKEAEPESQQVKIGRWEYTAVPTGPGEFEVTRKGVTQKARVSSAGRLALVS